MPENYFLGTFIQILNDGQFDKGSTYSNPYCVPTLNKIKEYATYRHIFR